VSINQETVEYVAHLSRIELSPDELKKLSGHLEAIVDFIDTLKKANVDAIPLTSHILPIHTVVRNDCAKESLTNEAVVKNAPQRDGNFFVVPKIIE
jgi:aspartyl-tRNA(Asn)/glutamyl-tRNA(Gln) amidotransferase subunit C